MSMSIEECSTPRAPKPTPSIPSNVMDQFTMRGRVAIITGGADGIGLSVAQGLAEAGAHIALWYNSNPAAVARAEELASAHGITAKAYKVPITDHAAVQEGVASVLRDFGGRVDVFVANAGMAISKPLLETTPEEYKTQFAVNVDGVVYCAMAAGKVFKNQGKGSFIITSSISAHIVNVPVDQPVYNASKAAITHLGKSLAREWRDFARVNVVSPGFFDTKMGASENCVNEAHRMAVLGRQGDVKEIKALYLYLASDASSFMTGSDVLVDGGYVLP